MRTIGVEPTAVDCRPFGSTCMRADDYGFVQLSDPEPGGSSAILDILNSVAGPARA